MESGVLSTRSTGFLDLAVFYRGELFGAPWSPDPAVVSGGVFTSVRLLGYQWRFDFSRRRSESSLLPEHGGRVAPTYPS